jgi:hypothetical protein
MNFLASIRKIDIIAYISPLGLFVESTRDMYGKQITVSLGQQWAG